MGRIGGRTGWVVAEILSGTGNSGLEANGRGMWGEWSTESVWELAKRESQENVM